ncbi:MAG TPA: hypothetical protein VG095_00405, partial [Chthoniobacterales bacterium]|nr:hypothetical protein [Chthoniobacterales bacterium]
AARRPLSIRERAWSAETPRFIELTEEQSIATVHFPRGLYSLDAEDARGYYYRSLGPVIKRSFAGFDRYEGGIFVAKNGRSIRGYIVWAGGYTRIGDLRRAPYRFRS